MQIITNGHLRDVLYWWDLTEKERAKFDWIEEGRKEEFEFARFKGQVYCLSEFEWLRETPGWDGGMADTVFSGVVFRYPVEDRFVDTEHVIMGWYVE